MTDHMHPINYTVYTLVLFFASELYVKYLSYESFCNYCRLYTCPIISRYDGLLSARVYFCIISNRKPSVSGQIDVRCVKPMLCLCRTPADDVNPTSNRHSEMLNPCCVNGWTSIHLSGNVTHTLNSMKL